MSWNLLRREQWLWWQWWMKKRYFKFPLTHNMFPLFLKMWLSLHIDHGQMHWLCNLHWCMLCIWSTWRSSVASLSSFRLSSLTWMMGGSSSNLNYRPWKMSWSKVVVKHFSAVSKQNILWLASCFFVFRQVFFTMHTAMLSLVLSLLGWYCGVPERVF